MFDYEIKRILYNGKKNILWGAGQNGVQILLAFAAMGIPVEMFCDSDRTKQRIRILNKRVIMPEKVLENPSEYNFIVTLMNKECSKEITDKLEEQRVKNFIVWNDIKSIVTLNTLGIKVQFRGLYRIIQDSYIRKIVIYGTGKEAAVLKRLLEMLDVKIAYFVDDIESECNQWESQVKPIYDLLYEKEGAIKVIVMSEKKENMKVLDRMGLAMGRDYSGYDIYTTAVARKYILDPNLGYSFQPKKNGDTMPGIVQIGDGKIVIALLGGSTTEGEGYSYKSWAELLFDKLTKKGYSVKVLNAGCGGYSTPQELGKLIRDIIPLKPDIIIHYTGVNDSTLANDYPFVHVYQKRFIAYLAEEVEYQDDWRGTDNKYTLGVKHNRSNDQMFIDNIKMMNIICKGYGIPYLAFLQPCLPAKKEKLSDYGYEVLLHLSYDQKSWKPFENTRHFYEKVCEQISAYGTDITSLFDGADDVYLDWCHVNEHGNEMIAQYMCEYLIRKGIVEK
ncbi:hypothetical protein C823_005436 [Eubacterium plexicaudatum ASF492]|uniref:SGNH hydrolase-type esterase domain-containing protein n=1 Tax=Eubacterium plexicaudatum ASF492 TaxID=1235802 RepID=N2AXK4_9FIRM|nr:hypothetical protein C823_005436 [Eubacterium plexicaudatum ASF492]